jgi:hypothetical protein
MTPTEKMVQEVNGLFKLTGDDELMVPKEWASELELLRAVKKDYKKRLLAKIPKYKWIPFESLIPDMFIQALRNREIQLDPGLKPKKRAGPC